MSKHQLQRIELLVSIWSLQILAMMSYYMNEYWWTAAWFFLLMDGDWW